MTTAQTVIEVLTPLLAFLATVLHLPVFKGRADDTARTIGALSTSLSEVVGHVSDVHRTLIEQQGNASVITAEEIARGAVHANVQPKGYKPDTDASGNAVPGVFVPLMLALSLFSALPAQAAASTSAVDPNPATIIHSISGAQAGRPCGAFDVLAYDTTTTTKKIVRCVATAGVGVWTSYVVPLGGVANHATVLGTGTATPGHVGPCTNGQIQIGQTAADPACTTISGAVTIDNTGTTTYSTVPVTKGGTNLTTIPAHTVVIGNTTGTVNVAGPGANGSVFVGLTGGDPVFQTMSGDATIANSGAVTLATVAVTKGGTNRTSLTPHSPLVGNNTSAVSLPTPGTSGQLFLGVTASDPVFATMSGDATIAQTGAVTLDHNQSNVFTAENMNLVGNTSSFLDLNGTVRLQNKNAGTCVLGTSCTNIPVFAGADCICIDASTLDKTCKPDAAPTIGATVTFTGNGTDTLVWHCF